MYQKVKTKKLYCFDCTGDVTLKSVNIYDVRIYLDKKCNVSRGFLARSIPPYIPAALLKTYSQSPSLPSNSSPTVPRQSPKTPFFKENRLSTPDVLTS